MKKVLSLIVAITMLFASCSKERKLNKKLDGKWEVETIATDGVAISPSLFGGSIVFEFSKDKRDTGDVTIRFTDGTDTQTRSGSYKLTKDEKVTITLDNESEEFIVQDYSKDEMTMDQTDESGEKITYNLKKK
jgi:hypothetical protein